MTPNIELENLYKVLNNRGKTNTLALQHALLNYFVFEDIDYIKIEPNADSIKVSLINTEVNSVLIEHLRSGINLTQYHLYLSYPNNTIELILVRS